MLKRNYDAIGNRTFDVWDGDVEGVYVPTGERQYLNAHRLRAEVFIAGARYDKVA